LDGAAVGFEVCPALGERVGFGDGVEVGVLVGDEVGHAEGFRLGVAEGSEVGTAVTAQPLEGFPVGNAVGNCWHFV
jgi:hypothetical protein